MTIIKSSIFTLPRELFSEINRPDLAYSPRSWLKLTNLEMSDSFSFRKKFIFEEGYTAQALVNKEVWKQLPDTVSDDALGKKKEMFSQDDINKILIRRFLQISMNADFEVAYSSDSCLLLVVDDLDVETDNDELEVDNEEIDL
ncbi:unnamed protein product [Rhizophagus irregularis]|nr:unnamed protein product [Rhizophagus irregularis]